jgi:hypothetical protein
MQCWHQFVGRVIRRFDEAFEVLGESRRRVELDVGGEDVSSRDGLSSSVSCRVDQIWMAEILFLNIFFFFLLFFLHVINRNFVTGCHMPTVT